MAHSPPRPSLVALMLVALAACSSGSSRPSTTSDPGAPPPIPAKEVDEGCAKDTSMPAPGATCVAVVRGQVLDGDGKPLSLPLSLCGGGLFCQGTAVDDGVFAVEVNRYLDLSTFVIHVFGHPLFGDTIVRLEKSAERDVRLGTLARIPRLVDAGAPFPDTTVDGLVVRTGAVELTLPPGTSSFVLPGHVDTQEFRVGAVPEPTKWDPKLIALYAMGPFAASFSTRVGIAVTLPPSTTIADGATVELVVLDDDLIAGTAGQLRAIGAATVTAGVARSNPGVGVDHLTWIGVRMPAAP